MRSHDSDPEATPDETSDASSENERDASAEQSADRDDSIPLSRRTALTAVAGLGGLNLLSGSAHASHGGPHWNKDVDAEGNHLFDLGSLAMTDNPTGITDFEGTNLSIDGSGVLNATDTDTDTRTNVSDDGTQVVTNTADINFGSNLGVTDDGDGSVTVDAATTTAIGTGASVGMSTTQTVEDDVLTTVEFDQVEYDDNNEFDTGTHAFVPDVDGTYQVESALYWRLANVEVTHEIAVNGDTKAGRTMTLDGFASTFVSRVIKLTAGDEVTIQVIFAVGDESIQGIPEESYATFTRLG